MLANGIRSYVGRMLWHKHIDIYAEPPKQWKPVMIVEVEDDFEYQDGGIKGFVRIAFFLEGEIQRVRIFNNNQFHSYFKLDDPRT